MSTLPLNAHTPVDATSGAVTMTLPATAAAGDELSCEKYDNSLNVVTVSGSVKGTTKQDALKVQGEIVAYRWNGSTWWPIPSQRKTVIDLRSWGVRADGTTDDAPAINAAIAANSAVQKHFRLPAGTIRLASPIIGQPNVTIEGLCPSRPQVWTGWYANPQHTILIPDTGVDAFQNFGYNNTVRNMIILLQGNTSARVGINAQPAGAAAFAFPRLVSDTGSNALCFESTFENIGIYQHGTSPSTNGAAFYFEKLPYSCHFKNITINTPIGFTSAPPFGQTIAASGIDATTDTITLAAHGYTNGQQVAFWWDELFSSYAPGFLPRGTNGYFVVGATTNTFQISLTNGGAAIDITATNAIPVYVTRAMTYTTRGEDNRFDGVKMNSVNQVFAMFNMVHNEFVGFELYPPQQGFCLYRFPSQASPNSNNNRGMVYQEGPYNPYTGTYYSVIEGNNNTLELSHGPLYLDGEGNRITHMYLGGGPGGSLGDGMGANYKLVNLGRNFIDTTGKRTTAPAGPGEVSMETTIGNGGASNVAMPRFYKYGIPVTSDFRWDPVFWLERTPASRMNSRDELWTPGASLYLPGLTTASFDTTFPADATADTGRPLHITTTGTGNSSLVPLTGSNDSAEHLLVGTNFPATKHLMYIRLKADSATTATLKAGYGVGSFTSLASQSISLTTSWQIFTLAADYSAVSAGSEVVARIDTMSPVVGRSVDWVAWIPARDRVSANRTILYPQATEPLDKAAGMAANADGSGWNPGSGSGWYIYDGSTWNKISAPTPTNVQVFTAGGTWTKPANAKRIAVKLIGGGAGGGSGRRGATATVRCGGGGGGSGALAESTFDPTDLTATVAVTVGAAGTAGAAVTVDDTSGNPGGNGSASAFGSYLRASGGALGSGGTAATGTGGVGGGGMFVGATAASASTTGLIGPSATAANSPAPGAGGAGGGITSANVAGNGGAGSASIAYNSGTGATGGVVDTTVPQAGLTTGSSASALSGGGGGGGGASITTAAQAGGAGGAYGAGGGGGGASLNGSASGAGGAGSAGVVVVTTYF